VVPIFNEEARLKTNGPSFVSYIESAPSGSCVMLVDDGSADTTAAVAKSMAERSPQVVFLKRPHFGKGAAVAHGLAHCDTPLAGYTDVDLSTPLHEVDRLFSIAASTPTLVIASRDVATSRVLTHQNSLRERLGRTFNTLVRATITPGIHDTQCGAKFARRQTWDALLAHTKNPGFAWDAEAVAVAQRLGLGVSEIGIEWSHDPMTRVNVIPDGIRMAVSVLAMLPPAAQTLKCDAR
jgi:glycosyltransferase involved in cell wall biosynthesis